MVNQCLKPHGLLGRFVLWNMNKRHSSVTDWGLSHVTVQPNDAVLDAGCGGGRTVNKLATMASAGKVFGIDFSAESVAVSQKTNAEFIRSGRVEICEASVSQLPFSDNFFDLITAVEQYQRPIVCFGGRRSLEPFYSLGRDRQRIGCVAEFAAPGKNVSKCMTGCFDRQGLPLAGRDRHINVDRIGGNCRRW